MTTDWTVLDIAGVMGVAHSVAARVATKYQYTAEYDDVYQEALIRLAEVPDVVRCYLTEPDKGIGLLHHRLWCDIVDSIKTEAKHRCRHISYELAREGAE